MAKRANTEPAEPEGKPECFVVMPISDPKGYQPGHFRSVYRDIVAPACTMAGFEPIRGDMVKPTNLIHLDILRRLLNTPMAVCDLSSHNPNCLFELALRHAFDKPIALIQETGTAPIFDIAPLRHQDYRPALLYREVPEDQERVAGLIKATYETHGSGKDVNSIVKLLALTDAAALPQVSPNEETQRMFAVLRAEVATLRSDPRPGQLLVQQLGAEVVIQGWIDSLMEVTELENGAFRDNLPLRGEAKTALLCIRASIDTTLSLIEARCTKLARTAPECASALGELVSHQFHLRAAVASYADSKALPIVKTT